MRALANIRRKPTARTALFALLASLVAIAAHPATAEEPEWHHASALTGDSKYPADFKHFDYVNPAAPKGGIVRLADSSGFDSFNPILPRGNVAIGLGLLYDSLTESSLDELNISASYGLIAEAVRYPDDYSWVEYRIDPKAKWHDGVPITVEDVIWSFEKVKELNPSQSFYYRHVAKAEDAGDGVVRFTFDASGNRELPHIVGQLLILPKHWWEGVDANGKQRSIENGTLEPPLGSGPYRIADFEPGRYIVYERVPGYWAEDHPARVGTNNFDRVRYDTFRDTTVLLEAFKGDQYDFRAENSAKNWATGYDFPAVKDGRVILETFPDRASGVMQAFVPNLRREKFSDERVRRALNLAYDFETANKTTFFGQYKRVPSYFAGTELASSGLPEGKELEILESVRDLVPPEVFTSPYENPVNGDPQKLRENLRTALNLLNEAGYELRGNALVNKATGEPFTIEFLANDPNSERLILPYARNLQRLGIKLNLRVIDTPQYINRIRDRDFDMITAVWGQSLSPGNEQLDFWGSDAADRQQSRNYAGIKDKGVDALIQKVIFAKDREELVAATRALDRVLLAHNFVVPQFYLDLDRTARWDRFGHPENLPEYSHGFPTIWWWDAEKAKRVGGKS
ncbi:ABC transporter substrate-binding protein [Stappia sp. F7233]|uniref:ABC transporter substrate-binding protein n=1 Tax=Stappia albiluteola TaxID=2758565 RepID=A0A839AAP8_9HYPH|nr:extracellular solute-binding protein [Stappia albiluteola]MBA5776104.1 ABC transporter substrate-binding protein [Stappia albiluteola]